MTRRQFALACAVGLIVGLTARGVRSIFHDGLWPEWPW